MAEERAQRRLAAILAADVVGYSRLMERDEGGTLAALKARRREVLEPLVAKHRGRIFKITGDGMLVEFASAVSAVQCAVAVQKRMRELICTAPDAEPRIVLRIGINLGDIIVDGDDLYGDGINVATRLESLAEPGGIVIAGAVYDQVENKLLFDFDDLGNLRVKNISRPVHAYSVVRHWHGPEQSRTLIRISVMPSFAEKWLVPRLGGFKEAHPDIDILISAYARVVDFDAEDVDLAIRYGHGDWPGLRVDPLIREGFFPVCAPRLLAGPIPLKTPLDLLRHTLLYDSGWGDMWPRWFAVAGVRAKNLRHTLEFNQSNLTLQAAINGVGVALSQSALVGDDISAGRLVKPFDIKLVGNNGYHLVVAPAIADRPEIAAFRKWLMEMTRVCDVEQPLAGLSKHAPGRHVPSHPKAKRRRPTR
jgi:LysR family glycine cleavage system transcriptional activator